VLLWKSSGGGGRLSLSPTLCGRMSITGDGRVLEWWVPGRLWEGRLALPGGAQDTAAGFFSSAQTRAGRPLMDKVATRRTKE
jgi:hypothetical protein